MIGTTLSHFRITAKLGEGGMGEVYLAEDTNLQRQVALKILPGAMTDDAAAKERFLQEAMAASSLDHANVCTIYEVGETQTGQMFLAMAYYGGQSLKQKIVGGGLDVDEAVGIALEVARGLARAHGAGITHRDIKPANIMLTEHGEAKIVDFGLAKLAAGARLTQPGTTMGTPGYMAPEQVHGEDPDGRTDLWSLGVVLYEMLTGLLPFRGGNDSAVIYSILHAEPQSAERDGEPVQRELQGILDRALAKDLEKRYQTADELASDLEGILRSSSERTLTMAVPVVEKSSSRGKALVIAAAVLVLGALGYLAFRSSRAVEPAATPAAAPVSLQPAIAVLPFTVRGSPDYQYLSEGMVDLLGTKFDGAGDLRSVDSHALLSYANQNFEGPPSREEAQRLAETFGASFYVLGEVLEAAGKLHISASLYRDDDSEALSRATVDGLAEEIFGLLDSLAGELLAERVTGAAGGLARTAALTTESLPALKAYLQAESQLRSGRFNAALESFQEAVALDADFALAWYRMSVAAEWASVGTDVVMESALQAVRLSDRLSERYKRLLAARLAANRGDTIAAESQYRNIVGSHPEDVEAWAQLGELLSHQMYSTGRSNSASREAWERVLELDPNSVGAMWHLARVAALEGKTQELQSLADRILELSPEGDRTLEIEALLAYGTGNRAAQKEALEGLREVSNTVVALTAWALAISGDRPEAVLEVAEILTEPSRSRVVRAQGYSMMAYTELSRGRWGAAEEYLEQLDATSVPLALEHRGLVSTLPIVPAAEAVWRKLHRALSDWDASQVPPVGVSSNFFDMHDSYHQQFRLYLIGVLEALLGEEKCLQTATELEALPGSPEEQEVASDLAAGVRARWWRQQGDDDQALEELESITLEGVDYQEAYGSAFLSSSPERFLRAEILLEQGRVEEALPLLRSFGETSYFDETFVAPSYYREGEAYEQLEQPEQAIESYQRVVDLWQDCQPPLCSWVDDAKENIVRLSESGS